MISISRFLHLFFFLLFTISFVWAQKTQLTDIISSEGDLGSGPNNFIEFNNLLFFTANTETEGSELWVTDGTIGNEYLLKDINIGKESGIPHFFSKHSVVLNNKLFFVAKDNSNATQIWSTDGTPEKTIKITNIPNVTINKLTLVGNSIFFLIQKENILQVWKSDGTNEGTVIVKDELPIGSYPSFEGSANNIFFFTFQSTNTISTAKVWRSDGTESGTFPITKVVDGNGAGPGGTSALTQYITFNNELYFVIRDSNYYFSGNSRIGIMKTDGTIENTVPVKNLYYGGSPLTTYADVILINNKLYFSFFIKDNFSLSIWESDGTEIGTKNIYHKINNNYFTTSQLATDGQNLIFTGANDNGYTSLLKMNLSTYIVDNIKELINNNEGPSFFAEDYSLCLINEISLDNLLLSVPNFTDSNIQYTGWSTDGTELSTSKLEELNNLRETILFKDNFYYNKQTNLIGKELWRGNIETIDFNLFANINTSKSGLSFKEVAVLNNKLFFSADDGTNGFELWQFDKLTREVSLLKDFSEDWAYSNPENFITLNDKVFFTIRSSNSIYELWQTDGTEIGTKLVTKEIEEEPYNNIFNLTTHNNLLYFFVSFGNAHRQKLVQINENGISIIQDLGVNNNNSSLNNIEMVSTENYIYYTVGGAGVDLWKSDGTESGTTKILDLYDIENLTSVGENVFFTGKEIYTDDVELWKSDGSEIGTSIVKDIGTGHSSNPQNLFNYNNQLVFTANTVETGRELWISDGTAEGTILIKDINEGKNSSIVKTDYAILNNILYFTSNDGISGLELWKTNGTMEETVLVKDINTGETGSFPEHFSVNGTNLFFSAYTESNGFELWSTDGTTTNTTQIVDIIDGSKSSQPSHINFVNGLPVFVAETGSHGRQLWSFEKSFTLPYDNFKILTTGESCSTSNNGSIEITALQNLNYIINITGNGNSETQEFSDNIVFNNLLSGEYHLCITIEGQDNYEFCSSLNISEPDELGVSSKINVTSSTITLFLSGASQYTISLNDKSYTTTNNQITLALGKTNNTLSVKTEKDCQGTYEEKILLNSELSVFPNPVSNGMLNIVLKDLDTSHKKKTVSIYSLNGSLLLHEDFLQTTQNLSINIDTIPNGIYLLIIKTNNLSLVHKIIKQ